MCKPEDFTVSEGILIVSADILSDGGLKFDEACRELLDSHQDLITIDLSLVAYIDSTHIGIIAATFFQACAKKKELRLPASPRVRAILRSLGSTRS